MRFRDLELIFCSKSKAPHDEKVTHLGPLSTAGFVAQSQELTDFCFSSCIDTSMVPRGLEPRTLRLLAVRSNQLSYETSDVVERKLFLYVFDVLRRTSSQLFNEILWTLLLWCRCPHRLGLGRRVVAATTQARLLVRTFSQL